MIHVNLLGEKQDFSSIYAMQLFIAVSSLALTLLLCIGLHISSSSKLSSLTSEKEQLETQLIKLREQTKTVEELEAKRTLLREKLTTIAVLKKNKQGPVKMLDYFANSIPEQAWISEVNEKNGYLEVKGVALDNQIVSTFIAAMEKAEFFDQVKLVYSQEFIKDEVNLKEFLLSLRLKNVVKKKEEAPAEDAKKKPKKKKSADKE